MPRASSRIERLLEAERAVKQPVRAAVHSDTRLAAKVKRYHTWPMLEQQSVAEHSFHCMRLWFLFWGALPPAVSSYFLFHDLGEIVTGDLPYPVKARNPAVKEVIDTMERKALADMLSIKPFNSLPTEGLSEVEKKQAKICDLLEMFEVGFHEYMLGNCYAWPIIRDTWCNAFQLRLSLPHELDQPVTEYMERYGWVFDGEEGCE